MKKKTKKTLIFILSFLIVALTVAYLFISGIIHLPNDNDTPVINDNPIVEPVIDKEKQELLDIWNTNHEINNDYVGEIIFESNLINKSFVQATSVYDADGNPYHFYTEKGKLVEDVENYSGNDVYIWTNWKDMTYDYDILGGSVFMDYRNSLFDQNIIIYGHHFSFAGGHDPSRIKAFTPLELLLEEENYEANKNLKLVLANEIRNYELVGVYKYDSNDSFYLDTMQYYRCNYNYDEFNDTTDNNYYQNYINGFNKVKYYDTGVNLTTQDSTLTLQTCISGSNTEFEIVLFRLVDKEYYD